ncbi:hypothetical protein D9615_009110 [Tricholomella constricta]|uniref:AA9 family lytic polysaccharide monooxygenase n=1 Tax=Tricholomella constricta TaxID=117010 RepID=A0A8H5H0R9_9AGAR|nr:hypothetical protein D9615_009110 [Tricholomella constricta]
MLYSSLAVLASFLVSQAAAHGGVTSYVIGGTNYVGWSPYNSPTGQTSIERPYSTYDPILSPTASTISCNNNGQAGPNQLSATVPAGTSITAKWTQWTHAQGPVMVYMTKCSGSCTSNNSNNLQWSGVWGTGEVQKSLQYTTTIPAALAAGEYLIRHELLALHQANTPQFYPECTQLTITGGGGKTPSGSYLVKFPGAYSMSDPGVNINIYTAEAANTFTYTVPGPAVWNGQ